jgi:hypothetical protein
MLKGSTSSHPSSTEAEGLSMLSGDFISIGEALKLVLYFKGNKQEVLAFKGNVETAFSVINLVQRDVLYKFVLTCISGQPRTAIGHRNLDSWTDLREFLKKFIH